MMHPSIMQGIRTVLRKHLGIDATVDENTQLVSDLELDSLKQLTLVVELENYFQIRFDYGDETGLRTLQDVATLIETRQREQHRLPTGERP